MGACIEFQGHITPQGYGHQVHQGKQCYAHRLAYCEARGLDIEDIAGWVIRHTCDNPRCVNPSHLLIGTQADNMRDRDERGRTAAGIRNGQSKLNPGVANEIRQRHKPRCPVNGGTALAQEFGIHPSNISRIVKGKTWA